MRRDFLRNIDIFSREQLSARLHDSYLAAEAPEHLPELEADITATQHQKVLRHKVEFHD